MEVLVPFFGFFTSLMMVYYFIKVKKNNFLLLLYYLCSNMLLLTNFGLHFSKSAFLEAVFFVHFIPLSYLLGPLLFFYIHYTLQPIKFQKRDFLHLLPALLCIVYAIPFYILPFKEKIILAHEIINVSFNFHLKISFFSLEQILYFRSIHLLAYALFSLTYMKLKFYKYVKILSKKYKRKFKILLFDLENEKQITKSINSLYKNNTIIDVLINNAGIASGSLIEMTLLNDLKKVFQINFFSQISIYPYNK